MYTSEVEFSTHEAKKKYSIFLSNEKRFDEAIKRVFAEWPKSCKQFLTNEQINRIAWIGQASMYITTGVPAKYRGGFYLLSFEKQKRANKIAKINLDEWLLQHRKKDENILL